MARTRWSAWLFMVFCAGLSAQVYQTHFDDIRVDRERLPAALGPALAVDPASGAVDLQFPLGPGIGEGGTRFTPTLRAHLAPQITYTVTTLPGHSLTATSQATLSLQPGHLDLKTTDLLDHDQYTWVSSYELWNGCNGTFQLEHRFPEHEGAVDGPRLLRAYGYPLASIARQPRREDQDAPPLVKYATDGALVLGANDPAAPEVVTPVTWDAGGRERRSRVVSPGRMLVLRGGLAFGFSPLYDGRHRDEWGTVRIVRYRLTEISNPFGERVQISYAGAGPDGIGYTAEFHRGGAAAGPRLTLGVDAQHGSSLRLRVAYEAADAASPVFLLDAATERPDSDPEGVFLRNKAKVPEWCDFTDRLQVHRVAQSGTGQWVSFRYATPTFSHESVSLSHYLLEGLDRSNGTGLDLAWAVYPYRRNDARPGRWQGYFTQLFRNPAFREERKRAWCYGVDRITERDGVASRVTRYDREVPRPRWGQRDGFEVPVTFHTAITHPDGQVTLERYALPPATGDGGPGSPAEVQAETLAHLRLQRKEVRSYGAAVDWRGDLARSPEASLAWRVVTFDPARAALGQDGYPGRTLDQGAYPRGLPMAVRDARMDVAEAWSEAERDENACAFRRHTRVLSRGGRELHRSEETHTLRPVPAVGLLGRVGAESRTVTQAPDPLVPVRTATWLQEFRYEEGREEFQRLLGLSRTGPGGPAQETRFVYRAESGPEARLLARVEETVPGLPGLGGLAQVEHDALGRVTGLRQPGASWTLRQTLDGLGRVVARRDANGLETRYGWDLAGRLVKIEPMADGQAPTEVVHHGDQRGFTVRRGGEVSSLRFNGFGERIREQRTGPGGEAHRAWGYDPGGRKTWETGWRAGVGEDRLWSGSGEGPRRTWSYDALGRLLQDQSAAGVRVQFSHGPGSLTASTAAGATEYRFDVLGRTCLRTDAEGHQDRWVRDGAGRVVVAERRARGGGPAQVRRWATNGPGWLTAEEYPESGRTLYQAFTALGQPREIQRLGDGSGPARVLRQTFDALGRLLSRRSDDGTVDQAFAYDGDFGGRYAGSPGRALDRLSYTRDGAVETFHGYGGTGGALHDLTTRLWPSGAVGAGRSVDLAQFIETDRMGHRVRHLWPGGKLRVDYDPALGLPVRLTRSARLAQAEYDLAGNLVALINANNEPSRFTYDADQMRLKSLVHGPADQPRLAWTYAYDAAGRLVDNGEDRFTYDVLDRLVTVRAPRLAGDSGLPDGRNVTEQRFAYDAFGNRVEVAGGGVAPSFALDGGQRSALAMNNRLPAMVGTAATGAEYDAQGQLRAILRSPGDTRAPLRLTWDALGRVTAVEMDGVLERYAYRADGLRTLIERPRAGGGEPEREVHLYDDQGNLVSRYDDRRSPGVPDTWAAEHFQLLGRLVAMGDRRGLHALFTDNLGSPRLKVNIANRFEAAQKWLPFGEALDRVGGSLMPGFTGHEPTDASGLICMQARFYAPWYGRFLSPDPVRDQHFEETQSWNIYSYTENNPVMRIDPDGMSWWDSTKGVVNGWTNSNFGIKPFAEVNNHDYRAGVLAGDTAALLQGVSEMKAGGAAVVGGGGTTVFSGGLLAEVGVPVAAGGLVVAGHGALVSTNAALNLQIDSASMMSGKPGGGSTTEPTLPPKTVAKGDGVKVDHYTKSGDHGPAHLHVKGGGPETKIGQNGKPIKGAPELTAQQKAVVEGNKGAIRRAVDKIQRWFRHNN